MRILIFLSLLIVTACKTSENKLPEIDSSTQGEVIQNCPDEGVISKILNKTETFAWKSLLGSKVAKKLMGHYLSCTGKPLELSEEEYYIINPKVYIYDKSGYDYRQITELMYSCLAYKKFQVPFNRRFQAGSQGSTLGVFSIQTDIKLNCVALENNAFEISIVGNLNFEDYWDFNVASHRTKATEGRVKIARKYLSGKPFKIYGTVKQNHKIILDSYDPNITLNGKAYLDPKTKELVFFKEPKENISQNLLGGIYKKLFERKDKTEPEYSVFGKAISSFFK